MYKRQDQDALELLECLWLKIAESLYGLSKDCLLYTSIFVPTRFTAVPSAMVLADGSVTGPSFFRASVMLAAFLGSTPVSYTHLDPPGTLYCPGIP